jgi:3-hydroxyacyl-[acyl-carrier-protein] dehydratase
VRFFLIDRITAWEVGKAAEAVKNVAMSEDFFDDHFPRRPVMPGVLMIEGMAQLAGLLLETSLKAKHDQNAKAILTILERTKFRDMVRQGQRTLSAFTSEDLHQEVNIPAGHATLHDVAFLAGMVLDQTQGEAT